MSKTLKKTWVVIVVAIFAALAYFGLAKTVTVSAEALHNENLVNAPQAYSEENSDLGFTLVDGVEYKVRAVNKNLTAAIIPAEYNGLPVTEIAGNGFMSCKSLTSIYIPKTVKTIGSNAFYNCTAMTRVYGASNLESISSNAFYNCTSLKYFSVPSTIQTMGNTVFRNVPYDIYVRMSEEELQSKTGISATWANSRKGESQIIYGTDMICEAVDENAPLDGYKLIQAQKSNASLLSRSVRDSYFICSKEEINEQGETVEVPITEIDGAALEGWTEDELIIVYSDTLPKDFSVNVVSLAFCGLSCSSIKINVNITIIDENDDSGIATGIFSGAQMETLYLPDTIDIIPDNTFEDCINLAKIYHGSTEENRLSQNIKSVGSYAFANCGSLQRIYIPNSVEKMGEFVFYNWGAENKQEIEFDKVLPPADTEGLYSWKSGIGDNIDFIYKTTEITLNNHNGGENTTVQAMYGKVLPLVTSVPTAPNEWQELKGYFLTEIKDGNPYYDENMNPVKVWGEEEILNNVTQLHAVWENKEYTVSLNADDGSKNDFKVTYGDYIPAIAINKPTRTGYIFNGFFSGRNGNGVRFYDSDLNPEEIRYTDLSIDVLYAYWTPIRYQVSLLPGEGSGGTQSIYIPFGTTQMYLDKDATEPVAFISVPTREHYIFAGYFTKDGKQYFSAEEVNGVVMAKCVENWEIAFNDNLDARWQIIHYNFTYVGYMDDGSDYVESITIDDITASDKTYRREELKKVKEGIKRSWSAIMLASSELKDLIIYSTTSVATLSECYDSDTQTYTIWYPSQFDEMRNKADSRFGWITGNFELMTDIDLSSYKNWTPIPTLFGSFKGNSHTVSGMNIQVSASGNYGLFESNVGLISLLTVSGNITVASGVKDVNVGLLCGRNGGRIERCYTEKGSSYSIESNSYFAVIGGLTGYNRGVVYNVANRAGIYGKGNIGGIVGKNEGTADSSFISLASSQGEIYARSEGSESVGGIVAIMSGGRIESCTCTGKITVYGVYGNGSIAMPCVGQVIGTFYDNKNTSYGTQMVLNTIVKEGKPSGINIGGDIGKTIFQPDLGV